MLIAGHFYIAILTQVLFVKVLEHTGISKYRDKSIGASFIYFLEIITVLLH